MPTSVQPDERRSYAWQQLRRSWAARIRTGDVTCPRCGLPILPGMKWDLGHRIDAQHGGTMTDATPEHRHCNRSAGARSRRRTWTPTTP